MLNIIKKILRFLGLVIIKPKDNQLIIDLKKNFVHNERSFIYKKFKLLIDCIYCHAAPGTIETTLTELVLMQPSRKNKKLLNLGGGTGQVSKIYESLGYDVYNIDIDIKPKDISPKNINFNLNEYKPIPINEKFDAVICQEIIEHLENPWKLFRDVKQILSKDGIFILSTPNITSSFSKRKFCSTNYFMWFSQENLSYHINPVPYWEIKLISDKNDFNLLKIRGNGDYYFDRNNKSETCIIKNNEELIFFFKQNVNS